MNINWIYIDSYKDLPEGEWLVAEEGRDSMTREGEKRPNKIHTASVSENKIVVIGGHFAWDRNRIYAYTQAPEVPKMIDGDQDES